MRTTLAPMRRALLTGRNGYELRYQAQLQPPWANAYADDTPLQDAVGFSIDTNGRRLEGLYICKPDGSMVRPLNIAYPGLGKSAAVGTGLGIRGGACGFWNRDWHSSRPGAVA